MAHDITSRLRLNEINGGDKTCNTIKSHGPFMQFFHVLVIQQENGLPGKDSCFELHAQCILHTRMHLILGDVDVETA